MNVTRNTNLVAVAVACGVFLIASPSDVNAAIFHQDFETDTAGWFDFGGTITRVPSGGGTLGVPSSDGSFHAEVTLGPDTGNGAFTRFGSYRYSWPGKIIQSLDVYIDPNAGSIGDGWFLDNAVNDNLNDDAGITTDPSDWREAGGVGALKATDGFWWVAADADGGAYQGPVAGGLGLQITEADWYTIVSEWVPNGDGLTVDRDTYIYNSAGTELYSNLNPAQVPLTGAFPIGGNRYGWIAGNSPTEITLAIDNSSLEIPEPTTLSLIGLIGLCALACRRRR